MSDIETLNEGWVKVGFNWTFILLVWFTLISVAVSTYYLYCKWIFQTFKNLGISGPQPIPFFGTSKNLLQLGMLEHDLSMRKYGKIVGAYQGLTPNMFVYDAEILRQMLTRDHPTFINRVVPPGDDLPVRKMMHMLKDDDWKRVRGIASPTFSSSKLRKMSGQISRCSGVLLKNLTECADKNETFDLSKYTSAFTMDVISSVAFGIEIDSHNDPNNKFAIMGRKSFTFKMTSVAIIVHFFFPSLVNPMNKLGYKIFPSDVTDFFLKVIDQAMDQRSKDKNDDHIDFLQLMINAHADIAGQNADNKNEVLSREELLAQGLLFFIAGSDTTANTLAFLGYQLAINPDIQDRLIKEIDDVMKNHDKVDYDVVKKMTYLEMCINETLRLYPAGVRTDRVASSDITINGVFFPKGMNVVIPIFALHRDPELWPEPEKFNPERFSAAEKEGRNPYCFVPFGGGPRGCAGVRLALTELKIATVTILQNLKFVRAPETEVPITLSKLGCKSDTGIKLRVEKRRP